MTVPLPLSGEEWYVLDAYQKFTGVYHAQERPARALEQVLEDAGKYTVGHPHTGELTQHAVFARRLAQHGYLEVVKGDGPIQYRLTQLGERKAMTREKLKDLSAVRRELENTLKHLTHAERKLDAAHAEIAELTKLVQEIEKPQHGPLRSFFSFRRPWRWSSER